MFRGSLSGFIAPLAVPATPAPVDPAVPAPSPVVADGVRSSTGAPDSEVGVVVHPARIVKANRPIHNMRITSPLVGNPVWFATYRVPGRGRPSVLVWRRESVIPNPSRPV